MHKPWFRERWPWLLMLPPAASVAAGFALLYFAVREPAPLAVDDYSRIEEISREESREDQRAAELRLEARLHLSADARGGTRVAVELGGDVGTPPPTLVLRLRHARSETADRTLKLDYDGREYVGRTDLATGRYDFEVTTDDREWRLAGVVSDAPTTVRVSASE